MSTIAALLLLALADDSLAKDARAVLDAHCRKCHGKDAPRAGFSVLDLKAVRSHSADLLHRVEAGMMPPGANPKPTRAERALLKRWIDAGAPDVPPPPPVFVTGDDYVLGEIARDGTKGARYLSLNHLLALADGPAKVAAARKELERMLGAFVPEDGKLSLDPIDKQKSVFRLGLASVGWDIKPFQVPVKKGKPTGSPLDLFDLVLLEYPYAVLSFKQPVAAEGVRPIPYVRGDWLLGLLSDPKFAQELLDLQGRKAKPPEPAAKAVWGGDVSLDAARAELGLKEAPGKLAAVFKGKALPRAEWERRFPALVSELELGTPILPLDGVEASGLASDPAFEVKAHTIRYELEVREKGKVVKPARPGEPATVFKARAKGKPIEGIALLIEPSHDAVLELALQDHAQETDQMLAPEAVPGGKPFPFDNKGRGFEVTPPASEDHWLVYAARGGDKDALPPGTTHRAKGMKGKVRDRFVHPWYKLADDGKGFARPLGAVARLTVTAKTVLTE
ncbi:MAG: hypothetical protein K2W96_14610 [Gemmataceae bacterium]|nr:hypothetical protein [Gemmataceae bacterium]